MEVEPDWAIAKKRGAAEPSPSAASATEGQRDKAAGQAVAKARKVAEAMGGKPDQQRILAQLILVLARLSVANTAELRSVCGVVFHTFLLPADNVITKAVLATGKDYHDTVSENPKSHSLGPPYLHIWVALVKSLGKADSITPTLKQTLELYWKDRICTVQREALAEDVRHCRLKKAFKAGTYKLQISISAASKVGEITLEEAIVWAVKATGGELKIGQAPQGSLEREARALLDKFGGEKKGPGE